MSCCIIRIYSNDFQIQPQLKPTQRCRLTHVTYKLLVFKLYFITHQSSQLRFNPLNFSL